MTESDLNRVQTLLANLKRVQTLLANLGFYSGYIDGRNGPLTEKAVSLYQKEKGLAVDGKIGPRTWAAMFPEPVAAAAKTGAAGLALIKRFEGLRLRAYPDPATGGEPWTIGYGHTSRAGAPSVGKGMTISADDAERILIADLAVFEAAVCNAVTRSATPNQFDAMVSLCFNIGAGNFSRSRLVKLFNAGDTVGAADAFLAWNKAAGRVMSGLTKRRAAERALFLKS